MTDLPQAAIDAAMDTIERLGAGGSRTTVRIVLAAAAPHIAAAERERIRQAIANLADEIDRMDGGALTTDDRLVAAETLRELASEGRLQQLTEGDPDGS